MKRLERKNITPPTTAGSPGPAIEGVRSHGRRETTCIPCANTRAYLLCTVVVNVGNRPTTGRVTFDPGRLFRVTNTPSLYSVTTSRILPIFVVSHPFSVFGTTAVGRNNIDRGDLRVTRIRRTTAAVPKRFVFAERLMSQTETVYFKTFRF